MINERMLELARRLLQKAEARQIDWEDDDWNDGYSISLNGNRVTVSLSSSDYVLSIFNEDGKFIDSISDTDIENNNIYSEELIKKIYNFARRGALKSDELIDDILMSLARG